MDGANGSWFPRDRQNSNPFHFTSGHEACQRASNATNIYSSSSFPEKEPRFSPKPGKRTRKLSLFSFHFNSKSNSEEKGRLRRSSQPAFNQPSPTTLSPDPSDVWLTSFNNNRAGSQNSLDSSPSSSRKGSSVLGPVERENFAIQDIIQETLKLQFDSVTEYNRDECDRLGKNVCQLVKRRVEAMKEASRQRCKIVSVVYVGAVRDYGIDVASQALLEADKDNFTVASYRNGKVFAVGGIIVIPLEK